MPIIQTPKELGLAIRSRDARNACTGISLHSETELDESTGAGSRRTHVSVPRLDIDAIVEAHRGMP